MNPKLKRLLPILGPGWVVMMADLDGPSVITAVESGIQFQGKLILLLLILVIPLYLIQSTSSRIGAVTRKSLGKIISERFGHGYTILTVLSTGIIDFAAYIGEFASASIASLILGIPVLLTILLILVFHTLIILSGRYIQIERKLVTISFILFIFPILDIFIHPAVVGPQDLILYSPSSSFLLLVAANIGAVIMPWMLFYHQSADVDRGINVSNLDRENKGTILGAFVSELLMISIVIFSWRVSQFGYSNTEDGLSFLQKVFVEAVGVWFVYLFALALLIASFLALLVISMSMSYAMSDALKIRGSFNASLKENIVFYSIYFVEIIPAAFIVLYYKFLIQLALTIMVINSIVLAFPLYVIINISSDASIMGNYVISKKKKYVLILTGAIIIFIGAISILSLL